MDSRDDLTKSVFNVKKLMPQALAEVIEKAKAEVLVVSYNDESWITAAQMMRSLRAAGHEDVRMLAFDSKRYVGAQIGIYNPSGERVGEVSRLRNVEYVFIAGPTDKVAAGAAAAHANPRALRETVSRHTSPEIR